MSRARTRVATIPVTLVAVLFAAACESDPLVPAGPQFSNGPQDQHCTDHRTAVKIEVPSGWSFIADGPYASTVFVTDTRTSDLMEVTVTIDGTTVAFTSDDAELETGAFCIKGGPNNTGALTGTSGNTNSIRNRGGQVPAISYVTLASVTSQDDIVACGAALSVSGGFQIYEATIEMGQSSGSFQFFHEALSVPDWFEIWHEGERIWDVVGGTQANSAFYAHHFLQGGRFYGASGTDPVSSRTVTVDYGSGTSTSTKVTLRVTGSDPGTIWSATVNCPTD
jgi:hypothetical protein